MDKAKLERIYKKLENFGQDPRTDLGNLETGFRHRTYYHKYFHGYTEIRRTNARGRVVIERRYTDPWHRHKLSTMQWVFVKIAYFLGLLLSSALFLWAVLQRIPTNASKIVALPAFLSGFLLLLLWAGVLAYVTAPRKMTWWEFRSGKRKVTRFSLLAAISMALTVLAKVGLCAFLGFDGEVGSMVTLAAAMIPMVAMFLAERKMPYEYLDNEENITEEERYEIL